MSAIWQFWAQSDAVIRAVALLLLGMSVSAWVLIAWKGWLLRRARHDLPRALAAFWAAPSLEAGQVALALCDRDALLQPLLAAAMAAPPPQSLEALGRADSQTMRRLRVALLGSMAQLRYGQVVLASVGSTAPFLGLFGTVWGIYHALRSISSAGALTLEQVSGPVGEALVMTAAGLAVAIPAVLAYNLLGQWIRGCESELEGYAHDLQEMMSASPASDATG